MKYKVKNENKFNVGLELAPNGSGFCPGINIAPHSFVMLTEDEIAYQDSKSLLFRNGVLTIDDEEKAKDLNMNVDNPNSITDSEIAVILKEAIAKMKKDLSGITEPFAKDKVFQVAKKNYDSLTGSKIDFIATFCGRDMEELKPDVDEDKKEK